eukprot:4126455-Pleurochrysis_carterae.AAC.2
MHLLRPGRRTRHAWPQALLSHPSLFRLDMCGNGIGPSGLRALSKLVAASKTLLCLNLNDNAFWSRVSTFAPANFSALAPLGKALAASECKLQLLSLEQVIAPCA